MLHSKRFFGLLVLATSCGGAMLAAGCGDDDVSAPTADSGTPDTSPATDSGTPDTSTAPDAADAAKPAPVFLDSSTYSDLFTIDPSFPYGVTQKHEADTSLDSASEQVSIKWGPIGPLVTTAAYSSAASAPLTVATWTFPADPTGPAISTRVNAAQTGVPDGSFYGADGFVALPFGPFELQSYTTTGAGFAGEVLVYAPAYDSIVSRAFADGFYSGVGVDDGTTDAIVYSGLSPLSATALTAAPTGGNGLYAAPLCSGKLLPTGPCAASHMLFGWAGSSGPVVSDTLGNVFVAAPLPQTSGEVYALSRTQALAAGPATKATLATDATLGGTASAAAIADPTSSGGWLLTIGYGTPVYGLDYASSASGVVRGSHAFAPVITPTMDAQSVKIFSDLNGNLWLAVSTSTAGMFFELQKKP